MTEKKPPNAHASVGEALVLGYGSALIDVVTHVTDDVFTVLDGVEKGSRNLVDGKSFSSVSEAVRRFEVRPPVRQVGGSAENTIFYFCTMGVKARFLGKVGNDVAGRELIEKFCRLGGEERSFKRHKSMSTGTCLCLVTPDAERTFFTCLGASSEVTAEDITEDDFEGVTHFHAEGYALDDEAAFEKALSLAEKKGCFISFDASDCEMVKAHEEAMKDAFKRADLVFANEAEAETFAFGGRKNDFEGALAAMGRYCRNCVVKLGGKGALAAFGGQKILVPAVSCKPVDTTGAGDAFQAGFLYGIVNGLDCEACTRLGNALAHEVVLTEGAMVSGDGWKRVRREFEKIIHKSLNWNA